MGHSRIGELPNHIHLVGIGGAGLSPIARVLLERGHRVTGSDIASSERTRDLSARGACVFIGHAAAQIEDAGLVLASSAIPEDNVELAAARTAGIPVVDRRQFLPALMAGYRCMAVAGTHGKTTTSAMVAYLLELGGYSPSYVVGGTVPQLGGNAKTGKGDCFVIEADEYARMFHGLSPDIAIITNIEMDHPDCYADIDAMRASFGRFVQRIREGGTLIACVDSSVVRDLLTEEALPGRKVSTYGQTPSAQYRVLIGGQGERGGKDFRVVNDGEEWTEGTLGIPGEHNALNATAALIAAQECGLQVRSATRSLADFGGVLRRFEKKGQRAGVVVIDDYAHHPTELRATISAARDRYPGRRLWAVFQPHTYSRTATLLPQFCEALRGADRVVVLDIYRARAFEQGDIRAEDIVAGLPAGQGRHISGGREATQYLVERVADGDLVLTLGAGDGYLVGEWLLDALGVAE